jgi:hypothetical protein
MYTEEAKIFRTAEMQILKQTGTKSDVECPVANIFSATEKGFCISQAALRAQEMKPGGGGPLINDSVTTVRVAHLLVSTGTIMMMMIINCYVCGRNRCFISARILEFFCRDWGKSHEVSHVAGLRPEI